MAKPLLPLCSIPTIANNDGGGVDAKMYLPFYGYWSADGEVLDWGTKQSIDQVRTMRIGGVSMPKTYQKDCCQCAAGGQVLIMDIPSPPRPPGGGGEGGDDPPGEGGNL